MLLQRGFEFFIKKPIKKMSERNQKEKLVKKV